MDKFLLSAVGFFAATVTCCLFALFSPQWVVSDFAGTVETAARACRVPDSYESVCHSDVMAAPSLSLCSLGFAQFGLFYSCHSTPGPGGTSRCTVASPHHSWLVATGLISAAVAFFVGGVTLFLVALVKCRSTHRLAAPAARRSLVSWGKWTAFIGSELVLDLKGLKFLVKL